MREFLDEVSGFVGLRHDQVLDGVQCVIDKMRIDLGL